MNTSWMDCFVASRRLRSCARGRWGSARQNMLGRGAKFRSSRFRTSIFLAWTLDLCIRRFGGSVLAIANTVRLGPGHVVEVPELPVRLNPEGNSPERVAQGKSRWTLSPQIVGMV